MGCGHVSSSDSGGARAAAFPVRDLLQPRWALQSLPTLLQDYTGGQLGALVEVMLSERVPLFVCAVGVPPRWVCDKLHANGTVIMNMIGKPKHAVKALASGVDIICAQGGEAGGHTGDIATLVLVPQVVDYCRQYEKDTGKRVLVTAAGGIYDGRG